jgi:hypothetical protein
MVFRGWNYVEVPDSGISRVRHKEGLFLPETRLYFLPNYPLALAKIFPEDVREFVPEIWVLHCKI